MKIDKRRKIQGKTDYKKRLGLLKSGMHRITIRKTNKYLNIQYVTSNEAKDKIIVGISSRDLLEHGWPKELKGSLKSISAAYLAGYLAGKKISEKEKNAEAIIDIGLQRSIAGSRIYAVLSGLIDAGIKIKTDKKILPKKERTEGKHQKKNIQEIAEKVKQKINLIK